MFYNKKKEVIAAYLKQQESPLYVISISLKYQSFITEF